MINRRDQGTAAENLVRQHLECHGLRTVTSNFHCRWGEIDLIMRDGDTLVFVEVRYRAQHAYGSGASSVDWRKQRKLARTAEQFMQRNDCADAFTRFDVVSCTSEPDGTLDIDWLRDAFRL